MRRLEAVLTVALLSVSICVAAVVLSATPEPKQANVEAQK